MTDVKRITLYKLKPNLEFDDYLRGGLDGYDEQTDKSGEFEVRIKYVVAGGVEKSEEQVPWLRFLNSGSKKKYSFKATNHFPRAIMALKFEVAGEGPRHYAAAFGQHGDAFLDKSRIVHDFGIRVGMNICDTDRLRRVQTTVHESISKQTERQASVGANLSVFGINTDSEFLRTISGYVREDYADVVESFRGRESISIKLPREKSIIWTDLVEICRKFDERYYSNDYQRTEFKVYDILRHETDPAVVAALDARLCAKLANKDFGKIHLSPPEFVESEELDFAYEPVKAGVAPPLFEDLRIGDVVGVSRRRLKNLTSSTVKSWKIYIYDSEQNTAFPKWNAYQCLIAEIDLAGKTYVLANGQWREVSPELKEKVTTYFAGRNLEIEAPYLPENVNIFDPARNQNREEVFNRAVAREEANAFLFDKGKVEIAGQGRYEICDLFHLHKHFVHVKRYTSGAGSISHIFTQTKLYSHAFSTDADTRQSFVEWIDASVEAENEGKDRAAFKALVPEKSSDVREAEYAVIFCLLHTKEEFKIADLPFMSQYELMLTHRFLTEDRRYNVGIVFRKVQVGGDGIRD